VQAKPCVACWLTVAERRVGHSLVPLFLSNGTQETKRKSLIIAYDNDCYRKLSELFYIYFSVQFGTPDKIGARELCEPVSYLK